jgi:short subunit dehydrogenase-like uncharacterized protein
MNERTNRCQFRVVLGQKTVHYGEEKNHTHTHTVITNFQRYRSKTDLLLQTISHTHLKHTTQNKSGVHTPQNCMGSDNVEEIESVHIFK